MGSFGHMGSQNHLDFGGGLLLSVREDIPCSILNIKQLTIEAHSLEINLRKKVVVILLI